MLKTCSTRVLLPRESRTRLGGSNGFTLIELLIAMSLTAMLGVLAVQFLGAAMDAEERSATILSDVNDVEQVWQLLASDLEQMAMQPLSQPVVGNSVLAGMAQDGMLPGLIGGYGRQGMLAQATALPGGLLLFDRHGWDNPLQQSRSEVQRVLYRMQENVLVREYWQENHQSFSAAPSGRLHLLASVSNIDIQFMPLVAGNSIDQKWVPNWPSETMLRSSQDNVPEELGSDDEDKVPPVLLSRPGLIAVTLETESLGRVRRLFALPGL